MASLNVEDIPKMKVADLKKELKDRGLPLAGTKAELVERLRTFLNTVTEDVTTESSLEASTEQVVEDEPPGNKAKVGAAPIEQATKTVDSSEEGDKLKKVVSIRGLSEAERLKARAEKFGGSLSDAAKKQMRAERFGLSSSSVKPSNTTDLGKISSTPASGEDMEKMKKRAERFGTVTAGKLSKMEEDEKRKRRLQRFGSDSDMVSAPTEAKTVKLSALTNVDVEQQKRKRAERFGLT